VAFDVAGGLRNRVLKTLHVGERRDQQPSQPGVIRLAAHQLFGEGQRRRPVALLEKRVEQQFFGDEVIRRGHRDRA
jgi:hypothetical protein